MRQAHGTRGLYYEQLQKYNMDQEAHSGIPIAPSSYPRLTNSIAKTSKANTKGEIAVELQDLKQNQNT